MRHSSNGARSQTVRMVPDMGCEPNPSIRERAVANLLQRLHTPESLSDLLGVPVATLYRWRTTGGGPPALRIGRHLRYRPADVERWLDERARESSR